MYFFEQLLYEAASPAPKLQTPKPQAPQSTSSKKPPVTPAPPPAPVPSISAAQAKQIQAQPLSPEQSQTQAEAQAQHAAAVAKQAEIHAQQADALAQKGRGYDIPDDFDFNQEDIDGENDGDQEVNGDISQAEDTTLIPIKRYYLIQKLFALNDKLNELRIKNDVLSLVISFVDSFSYQSLLALTNKFVEDIYLQVTDKSGDGEDKSSSKTA
jgi:hypothetical protein